MPVSRSSTAERVKNGTQRQFQCRSHTVRGALCDRPCPSELLLRSVVYVKRSRPKCSTAVPRLPNAGADYLPVPRTVLTHVSQTWTVKRTVRDALKHSTGKNINKRVSKTQTRHTGTALFPGGGWLCPLTYILESSFTSNICVANSMPLSSIVKKL